jgi:hypothetical protein
MSPLREPLRQTQDGQLSATQQINLRRVKEKKSQTVASNGWDKNLSKMYTIPSVKCLRSDCFIPLLAHHSERFEIGDHLLSLRRRPRLHPQRFFDHRHSVLTKVA